MSPQGGSPLSDSVNSIAPGAPLRKVVIVNTTDMGGGAERMSMTMLDGLGALGIETWLLVGDKRTDHPRVLPFFLSPYFDYRPYDKLLYQRALEYRRRADRWLGLEDFNHPYAHRILELTGSAPDLVLCHNLHGGYFDLRALPALSQRLPVVLRLFDSWLMTGHCAITLGCPRWQIGCGSCPDLTIPPAIRRDATRWNWARKRSIMDKALFYVTAESQWMLDRAKRSLLAPSVGAWKLIRGGVDLSIFRPGSRAQARQGLDLDPDTSIVLYVANHGPNNVYKDLDTVREALAELARRDPARRIDVLAIGGDAPEERIATGIVMRWLGYISSPERLATFYRAADVFVHSTVEDTYGLAVAEALASGTPIVIGSRGGVSELVEDNRTALVVPPRDPAKMADGMACLLDDPLLRARLGAAGAATARERFDLPTLVRATHDWFVEIHARWPGTLS